MNTFAVNPEDITTESEQPTRPPFQPRDTQPEHVLLRRSYSDRMLAGVAGGPLAGSTACSALRATLSSAWMISCLSNSALGTLGS